MSKDKSVFPVGSRTPIISFEESYTLVKYMEGRMLTIVDASFGDIKQREAVKSLTRMSLNEVRDILRSRYHYLSEHSQDNGSLEPWEFTPDSNLVLG